MSWRSQVRNRIMRLALGRRFRFRGRTEDKSLALTFDDGPSPEHTAALLEVLRRHGARATFFMTGAQMERNLHVVSSVVGGGHELGNHSYRHDHFHQMPIREQFAEFARTDELLTQLDGRSRHWWRPPQGLITLRMALAFAVNRSPIALWSRDSLDYRGDGVASIVARFSREPPRGGDILLFHDDNYHTVEAVDRLLAEWRGAGFEFKTISEI